jgi:hypothetical protein
LGCCVVSPVGRKPSRRHREKLCKLEQLPPLGFTADCFPAKVKVASCRWMRAVALFD